MLCFNNDNCGFIFSFLFMQSEHKETDKADSWNYEAKYKYEAEKVVAASVEKHVIIRPALVYGTGDRNGLSG